MSDPNLKEKHKDPHCSLQEYLIQVFHLRNFAGLIRETHIIAAHDGKVLRDVVLLEYDTPDIRVDHIIHIQGTGTVVTDTCCYEQRDLMDAAEANELTEGGGAEFIPDFLLVIDRNRIMAIGWQSSVLLSLFMVYVLVTETPWISELLFLKHREGLSTRRTAMGRRAWFRRAGIPGGIIRNRGAVLASPVTIQQRN